MKIALLSTSYLESFYKKELKELDLADIIDVYVYYKLVDCLEKCLIYGHIRRFAD